MSAIKALIETVARLRAPGGCPWDREQTHQSMCDCLIEEVSELLETIDKQDMEHMREELGDLLLHVVMHAQLAEEKEHFDLEQVAADINEKLIRRHPHVFGHMDLKDSKSVIESWDNIKASEKKNGGSDEGVFKGLPPRLPALLFAHEVHKQIVKKDFNASEVLDENYIQSLSDGLSAATAGRMLYEITAACRLADIDPESALRRHTQEIMKSINEGHSES